MLMSLLSTLTPKRNYPKLLHVTKSVWEVALICCFLKLVSLRLFLEYDIIVDETCMYGMVGEVARAA